MPPRTDGEPVTGDVDADADNDDVVGAFISSYI
jgi:hypothetical protein